MSLMWGFLFLICCFAMTASVLGQPCVAGEHGCDAGNGETDELGLLQKPMPEPEKGVAHGPELPPVKLIPLRKEHYPVIKDGKVISSRTTYSGPIHVGSPPVEFRVVFDTGSAHVILPSSTCESRGCLMHRQYDLGESSSGRRIRTDGSPLLPGRSPDSVTIGFGTASIEGEFVRDTVCVGSPGFLPGAGNASDKRGPCVECQIISATRLSQRPFEQFAFDGLFGLSLSSLAVNPKFSIFDVLTASGQLDKPYFAFFFAENDGVSELAVGGYNTKRLMDPLTWVPLAKTPMGYWQVQILGVFVNGTRLDICDDGTCHGILDSGTSHMGVPAQVNADLHDLLVRGAGNLTDCRRSEGLSWMFELSGVNLTLNPERYMRTKPLMPEHTAGPVPVMTPDKPLDNDLPFEEALNGTDPAEAEGEGGDDAEEEDDEPLCTPKLLPVDWPAPVGPKIFIFGEPMLQAYYTVFDWRGLRAGFGRAHHGQLPAPKNEFHVQDEVALSQLMLSHTVQRQVPGQQQGIQDEVALSQLLLLRPAVRRQPPGRPLPRRGGERGLQDEVALPQLVLHVAVVVMPARHY